MKPPTVLVKYSLLPPSLPLSLPSSPMDQEPSADDFFTGQGSPAAVHRLLSGVCMDVGPL